VGAEETQQAGRLTIVFSASMQLVCQCRLSQPPAPSTRTGFASLRRRWTISSLMVRRLRATQLLQYFVDHLRNFVSDSDVAVKNDVSELKFRLGALVQDAFGPLFTSAMTLDWDRPRKCRTRSAHSKHWVSEAPVSRRAIPSNLMKSSISATPPRTG
jgi:hypothetical protein